jgi:Zn-dependent protease
MPLQSAAALAPLDPVDLEAAFAPPPPPEDPIVLQVPLRRPEEEAALAYARVLERFHSARQDSAGVLLLVSLAVFALSALPGWGLRGMAVLVGVLLFHELGHWAGMRLFGFRDVRMFFIPFLGAAVSGRNPSASGGKEGVVLLLGPLPGLIAAPLVLAAAGFLGQEALVEAATMLAVLNGLNLLPLMPFDGGRLFRLLLFVRHRWLENGFTLVTSLVLLTWGVVGAEWVLGFLGLLGLLQLPRQVKLLQAVRILRHEHARLPSAPEELSPRQLHALHGAAQGLLPESSTGEAREKLAAQTMRELHERTREQTPRWWACLLLGSVWAAGLVLALVTAVGIGTLSPPPEWSRVQLQGHSVELPAAPAEGDSDLGPGPAAPSSFHTVRLGHHHRYFASTYDLAALDLEPPEAAFERQRTLHQDDPAWQLLEEHEEGSGESRRVRQVFLRQAGAAWGPTRVDFLLARRGDLLLQLEAHAPPGRPRDDVRERFLGSLKAE